MVFPQKKSKSFILFYFSMKAVARLHKLFIKIPPTCVRPKCSVRNVSVSACSFLASKKEESKTNEKSIMVLKPSLDHHDLHAGHYERNFITATRAMQDFLLKPEHLVSLRVTTRRSPNENAPSVKVYWRKDIEAKSIQIWGSLEAMEHEKEKVLERNPEGDIEIGSFFKRIVNKKRERRNWQSRSQQQQQSNQQIGKGPQLPINLSLLKKYPQGGALRLLIELI